MKAKGISDARSIVVNILNGIRNTRAWRAVLEI